MNNSKSEKNKISFWLAKLHGLEENNPLQASKNKGIHDAQQSISRQRSMDETKMDNLTRKSNRILASITSKRLPFDFFPDTINIEESRVTIINRRFISSSQVHSVDIKDISNIFINLSFLFAQLIIISRTFSQNNIEVDFLHKKEAIHIRRIIEGLRVFELNKIDTSNYSREGLLTALERLSTTEIVT